MFFKSLIVFFLSSRILAMDAQIAWDRNPEANVVKYKVYLGESSRTYTKSFFVKNTLDGISPTVKITRLSSDTVYYIAVSAVNDIGTESVVSNEVVLSFKPVNLTAPMGIIPMAVSDTSSESVSSNGLELATKPVNLGTTLDTSPTSGYPYGSFSASWSLPENGIYEIQKSTDLTKWIIVSTVNVTNNYIAYKYSIRYGESSVFLRVGKAP